jgi:hypothetical protein
MSGPVLLDLSGGTIGSVELNRISINALLGTAALYLETHNDEQAFELYIGGRLGGRETVCVPPNTPKDKYGRPEYIVPNCTRVK